MPELGEHGMPRAAQCAQLLEEEKVLAVIDKQCVSDRHAKISNQGWCFAERR